MTNKRPKPALMQELFGAVRANQAATDKMDEAAAQAMGVNRTDHRVLDLVQQRGPLPAGELARRVALSTGTLTAVIDRLEGKGYLRRVRDPADRRRVLVEMTELAQERAGALYLPLAERALPMVNRFTAAELETIVAFLRGSTEIVERRAAEVREEPGPPDPA